MHSDWYPDAYFAYIRSLEWRRVVARYFERHPRRCAACQSATDVQLHHKTYVRLEAEQDSDLAPLCPQCHSMVHGIQQLSAGDLSQVTDLWIDSFRTQPNSLARQRLTLKLAGQRPSTVRLTSNRAFEPVHVGMFCYVERRGTSFVTWSTFRRRPKAIWMSAKLEEAISLCDSVDRRAQASLAGSTPNRTVPPAKTVNNGPPLPQSLGFDDVDWFVHRPRNRAPSIRAQLAVKFSGRRVRSVESFGYAKNLPSTQNYDRDA